MKYLKLNFQITVILFFIIWSVKDSWNQLDTIDLTIVSIAMGVFGLCFCIFLMFWGIYSFSDWKSLIVFFITGFLVSNIESRIISGFILFGGMIISNVFSSKPFSG